MQDHLQKSWSIDQGSRIQEVEGSSEKIPKNKYIQKNLWLLESSFYIDIF